MWWLAIIPALIVAVEIFRNRTRRSLRAAALVVACTIAGGTVSSVAPPWTVGDLAELVVTLAIGLVGFGVVLAPLWILSVWNGAFSALPPSDFREHLFLSDVHRSLAQGATDDRLTKALAALRNTPVPADEWGRVREAMVAQISLDLDQRRDGRSPTAEEVLATRRDIRAAWDAAVASRRRFFR